MVSILPGARTPWDLLGQQIGRNFENVLPGAVQRGFERGQLQKSLGEIKELANQPGVKPLDLILATMQAGAGIPGSERYLSTLIPMLEKVAAAGASENVPLPGEQQRSSREPLEMPPPLKPIGFLGQKPEQASQFFPTATGPQGGPGQVPQAATTGVKRPIPTRPEMIDMARDLQTKSKSAGLPITIQEAMKSVQEQVEDDKEYNRLVDKELEQRVAGQQNYGQRGMEELKKSYPQATPEMETIFQKYGEEASTQGKSEADINRLLVKKAQNFSDTISNIRSDLSAPRAHTDLLRKMEGTYKDFEQSGNSLRVKLKPLLDEGLYDTSRNLLQELGYGPEEREIIIHPLSESSKIMLNKVPQGHALKWTPQKQTDNVKAGLKNLKQEDPNFSLVLARKAMEDKNYDWRIFSGALNDLVQNENFQLTDDQRRQLTYLDSPPLNILEKMLHGLGLIGR